MFKVENHENAFYEICLKKKNKIILKFKYKNKVSLLHFNKETGGLSNPSYRNLFAFSEAKIRKKIDLKISIAKVFYYKML